MRRWVLHIICASLNRRDGFPLYFFFCFLPSGIKNRAYNICIAAHTGRKNYQIKTPSNRGGRYSGNDPGFRLPYLSPSLYSTNPATEPLFFIIYFPGFLYVFHPFANGPREHIIVWKTDVPYIHLRIYIYYTYYYYYFYYTPYTHTHVRYVRVCVCSERRKYFFFIDDGELIKSNLRSLDRTRS